MLGSAEEQAETSAPPRTPYPVHRGYPAQTPSLQDLSREEGEEEEGCTEVVVAAPLLHRRTGGPR